MDEIVLEIQSTWNQYAVFIVFQYTDDVCFVLFAFFNVAWATLYLENWKRKGAEYAYKWGTLDKEDELLVEPRALFHVSLNFSTRVGFTHFLVCQLLLLANCTALYRFLGL